MYYLKVWVSSPLPATHSAALEGSIGNAIRMAFLLKGLDTCTVQPVVKVTEADASPSLTVSWLDNIEPWIECPPPANAAGLYLGTAREAASAELGRVSLMWDTIVERERVFLAKHLAEHHT